ncbi:glutathione s-transferase like protein, partial [Teratosphaeria destructans]
FSPFGQKTKLLLSAAGVQYQKIDEPVVLPRPNLEKLGITYRRIPLLAIGKDVYADTALIFDVVNTQLAPGKVPTSPNDKAWEQYGVTLFTEALGVIPMEALTPEFVKDRETVFPFCGRPDLKSLRPSAADGLRARMRELEGVLNQTPFLAGKQLGVADLHVFFVVSWVLHNLGFNKEPGTGQDTFPRVHEVIAQLPKYDPKVLPAEEGLKTIISSDYWAKGPTGIAKDCGLGLKEGQTVSVESYDTPPGSHPQVGKLLGTSENEVVIEVRDGVKLHFPKIGYIVRQQ